LKYRTLDRFIKLAKSYNLITGLAGSLKIEDIDKLIQLKPDYLGFRGALCSNKDRVKSIDNIAVKKIRDTISRKNAINYKNITNTEVIASGSVA
jgi:uncharacterized protein (UPF0264 family)